MPDDLLLHPMYPLAYVIKRLPRMQRAGSARSYPNTSNVVMNPDALTVSDESMMRKGPNEGAQRIAAMGTGQVWEGRLQENVV